MFKFIAMTYTDFVPEGKTEAVKGFKLFFTDDTPLPNGIGAIPFQYFLRPDVAASYGLNAPGDMANFVSRIGEPVELSFDRKGKIQSWSFSAPATFPPEPTPKPNKL